jgi:proteasome alpha subunit
MTEEPFRWLEAIANRRDYVQQQIATGTPVFAVSLEAGILLLGVGSGQSKVFEVFDRQAMAALGHPADIERVRQILIDAAHLEAFTRAGADVNVRRLVSFGLSPQLKQSFEQIFQAPFMINLLLAEVADKPAQDVLVQVNFDGGFQIQHGGVMVAMPKPELLPATGEWLRKHIDPKLTPEKAALALLQAWDALVRNEALPEAPDLSGALPTTCREQLTGKVVEAALLERQGGNVARYVPLIPFASG